MKHSLNLMRNSILLMTFAFLSTTLMANNKPLDLLNSPKTVEDFKPQFELHFTPLTMFFSGLEGGFEYQHRLKKSFKFNIGYYANDRAGIYNNFRNQQDWDWWRDQTTYSNWTSIRTEIQYKIYNNPEESKLRFYIAPFIVAKWAEVNIEREIQNPDNPNFSEVTNKRYEAIAFSGGLIFGIKERLAEKIYLDMYFGGGTTFMSIGDKNELHKGIIHPYRQAIHPRFGIAINFAI